MKKTKIFIKLSLKKTQNFHKIYENFTNKIESCKIFIKIHLKKKKQKIQNNTKKRKKIKSYKKRSFFKIKAYFS